MTKLSIIETLKTLKDGIVKKKSGVTFVIPDSNITMDILYNVIQKWEGIQVLFYPLNVNTLDKSASAMLFMSISDWTQEVYEFAQTSEKPLICLCHYDNDRSFLTKVNCDVIVCINERALSIVNLISELTKVDNPSSSIVNFKSYKRGITYAISSHYRIFKSDEFNSVMLNHSSIGPATYVDSYIDFLKQILLEINDAFLEMRYGYIREVKQFENVVWIECVDIEDAVNLIQRELMDAP